MTDQMLESVLSTAQMARNHVPHCCAEHCHARHYAYGAIAPGWERKLAELARQHGYSFHRDHLPEVTAGPGCSGFTVGSFRGLSFQERREVANLGIAEYSIHYKPSTRAEEFSVAVHELAHAVLGHPDHELPPQVREFEHEMPVRLASVAVCKAAGLKTGRMAICQLATRMRRYGRAITLEHQNAGLIAARVIGKSLSGQLAAA